MNKELKVSVIIPCRNEENFIGKVLENLLDQEYPRTGMEIIVVDGESDDNTTEVIQDYVQRYDHIRYVNNPDKVVPHAMNIGIRHARGNVIMRVDAHSEYPKNYVSRLTKELDRLNADNVGGIWDTQPGANTLIAEAIAAASSSPFGIGNAEYRFKQTEAKKVNTVPYGCYRRSVFERIGMYDQDLIRNQDDELNARLINAGGSICLIPDVKIKYFARPTLYKMMKMFYQYGFFKPLVNKKLGKPATARQFFPPVFVAFLFFTPIALLTAWGPIYTIIGLGPYMFGNFVFSLITATKYRTMIFVVLPMVFFCIHVSYGIGYWSGLVRFLLIGGKTRALEPSR